MWLILFKSVGYFLLVTIYNLKNFNSFKFIQSPQIFLSLFEIPLFSQSDEYSFLLRPDTSLHGRRKQKLVSLASSKFSAVYQFYWNEFFPTEKLLYPPSFDARIVLYPNETVLRDYFSWRQANGLKS